jgi:MtN3 and saliva related transmembrane protein
MAGFFTTLGFVPQIIKGYRSGNMKDVSLVMPLVLMLGMSLWLLYGIFLNDLPIVLWNSVAIALNGVIVFMKVQSDKKDKKN